MVEARNLRTGEREHRLGWLYTHPNKNPKNIHLSKESPAIWGCPCLKGDTGSVSKQGVGSQGSILVTYQSYLLPIVTLSRGLVCDPCDPTPCFQLFSHPISPIF